MGLGLQIIFAALAVLVASSIGTALVYYFAVTRRWLAYPNARSSHAVPTPSSGGVGLAVVVLGVFAVLGITGGLPRALAAALLGGGALVAIVGWIDDRRALPPLVRLLAHAVAAAWALWWIGGLDHLSVGFATLPLGMWGSALAFLAIIAFSNLYNFMDGIDGLIGAEAVLAGSVLALLAFFSGAPVIAAALGILAAAAFGFLFWNWHPARIFMGDVGSVLLGFCFAVLAVASEQSRALPALFWVILFAVVLVDAGFTTIRRMAAGERWYEAHRTFTYQRAVERGHRHSTVVLGMLVLDVVLAALAFIAWRRPAILLPATIVAVLLVTVMWASYQFRRVEES
ncbi:glycosyl transferase family 4 [Candidatus Uhrbacteria bacterium]|nr:glycosyl transferase family 4 [Candidatus Uhrbacteria bacterium]